MSKPPRTSLASLVHQSELLVTCGPGGVGKTTTAAALALSAAREGRRVIVVTVDPARRLADALGIDGSARSHDPREVAGAVTGGGSLWALMLDAETTFDRMITERSADEAQAQSILSNPVYRSIAGSLAGAQEYMAIERLHQLATGGEFDLVVLDTPPSRHAIDLLDAPDRLVKFFGHPMYRALTMPSRSFARVTNATSAAFVWAVRRLAGPTVVEDTINFFRALSGIEVGLRERAAEVGRILRAPTTTFVLVSSPRAEAVDEAHHLADALAAGGFPLGAVIVNLVHPTPTPLSDVASGNLHALADGALSQQAAFHRELSALACSERTQVAELEAAAGPAVVIEVPMFEGDIHDLAGLAALAGLLAPSEEHPVRA